MEEVELSFLCVRLAPAVVLRASCPLGLQCLQYGGISNNYSCLADPPQCGLSIYARPIERVIQTSRLGEERIVRTKVARAYCDG